MSWSLDRTRNVWVCTSYSDLNFREIDNLAEYGQPSSPYERGFDPKYDPDFKNIVVEMPQASVMSEGYGSNIHAKTFPIVQRFLHDALPMPFGSHYHFDHLVKYRFARASDRAIQSNLYGLGKYKFNAGSIDPLDAAYIHGTVGLALMKSTRFIYSATLRRVEAEIGALDDNWDFESSTIPSVLNAVVAATLGPAHYNLEAPIRIQYRGPGKFSVAQH